MVVMLILSIVGFKKKVNSATFDFQKKKSIPPPDLKVTHNSAHATDPDPSLCVLGQNFMVIPNIGSVWFGSVGIPSWARRPKLPVRARNSRLWVARTILTINSESTQNLGSGRVLWGVFGYLWADIQAPARFLRFGLVRSGSEPVYRPTKPEHTPKYPTRAQILRRFRIYGQNRVGYPQS